MSAPKLSILIPTLISRQAMYDRLVRSLLAQEVDGIEILCDRDDGTVPIGEKRNSLMAASHPQSRYIFFIDDDDALAIDGLRRIYQAIESGPDVVGISGEMTTDGDPTTTRRFVKSLDRSRAKEGEIYGTPGHLNPIRREIAIQVKYPPLSFGEDQAYARMIKPLLRTEVFVEGVYFYQYSRKKRDK